jgi:hypothetical protein
MKAIRMAVVVAVSVVISAKAGLGADEGAKFSTRVQVDVSGDESNQVASYVKSELRALHDVVIVDSIPLVCGSVADHRIRIVELPQKLNGGKTLGFSFSVVFTSILSTGAVSAVLDYGEIRSLLETNSDLTNLREIPLQGGKLVEKAFNAGRIGLLKGPWDLSVYERIDDHGLYVGVDNLRMACEKIVADFDTKCLEPDRKLWQQLQEPSKAIERGKQPAAN